MRTNRAQQQGRLRNQSRRQIKLQKLNRKTEQFLQSSKQELLRQLSGRTGPLDKVSPEDYVAWVESVAPQVSETPALLVQQARRDYSAGRFAGGISVMKIIKILLVIAALAFVKVDALADRAGEVAYYNSLAAATPFYCWTTACKAAAQAPVAAAMRKHCIESEGKSSLCPKHVFAAVEPEVKAHKKARENAEAAAAWDREAPQRAAAAVRGKKAADDKKTAEAKTRAAANKAAANQAARLAKTKEFAQTWAPAGAVALGVGGLTAAAAAEYKRRSTTAKANQTLGKLSANNIAADEAIEKAKAELSKAKRASGLEMRF
jgi:hypothetical protein